MARNRITKKLNIVDLSTAPDELPQVGEVQKTVDREFNPLEPDLSSSGLNQVEEFNPLEPDLSSSGLNQVEEFNPLEPDLSSSGLNQVEEFNPLEPDLSSSGLNQEGEFNPLEPESDLSSSGLKQVKRRGARGKQIASGYMYAYTKNKKLKSGITATFPKVKGSSRFK